MPYRKDYIFMAININVLLIKYFNDKLVVRWAGR